MILGQSERNSTTLEFCMNYLPKIIADLKNERNIFHLLDVLEIVTY